jgi:Tfp pilus assembly protein PilX
MKRDNNTLGNDRGYALVLALIVLFLMSVLGTMMFTNASSETQASRNYRVRQDAFYAAERAVEYARSDVNIYSAIGAGTVAIPLTGISLAAGSSNATGAVTYLSNGNPPRGSGMDATEFQANYFAISATGTGPVNSRTEVETNVARIIPKN